MRVNPFIFGIGVLVIFFGVIVGFQSAGIWSVSGKITSTGEQVVPQVADVTTIKGWMTLGAVSETFQVPIEEIVTQFELPSDTSPETALKDLESDLFSVTDLRTWLEARSNGAILTGDE